MALSDRRKMAHQSQCLDPLLVCPLAHPESATAKALAQDGGMAVVKALESGRLGMAMVLARDQLTAR